MSSQGTSRSSSPLEERNFLETWIPEPLVPHVDTEQNQHLLKPHIIDSKPGKYTVIDGVKCLDLATDNFLGLNEDPRLEEAAVGAVKIYGVGSCGPRAFYGTMDVHLNLEKELASFLNVEEVILYSHAFSTIPSAIAAYAKPGDIIFADEACNMAIRQGIVASRSEVIKFKHNDTKDLEKLVQEYIQRKGNSRRSFLIVESIYSNTGTLCPLVELIRIKQKYKIRLFVDESKSFGVLGSEGKGVTQHLNVDIGDLDLVMASLENSLCSYGGFCAGSTYVIDHQRLSGTGYCFSASLPPFQTQVALTALNIIRGEPEWIRSTRENCHYAHEVFSNLTKLKNISDPDSPFKILILEPTQNPWNKPDSRVPIIDRRQQEAKLLCQLRSLILTKEQVALGFMDDQDCTCASPSIRIVISGCLSRGDIDRVAGLVETSLTLPDRVD